MRHVPGIKLVISEYGQALPQLPVYKQLRFEIKNQIWIKESLVNLAVNRLPVDWKYVAWVDADITFLNKSWVTETVRALQNNDVVQLFQTAVNLGPAGESMKIDKSFGYMHTDSGTQLTKNDRYGFWHPGYAWAVSRRAWDTMGGLVDWAILGSGDRHMAMAWIGRVDMSYPGNIHPNYKAMLKEYQLLCKGFRLSYVPGTILHHWHGSLDNRRYRERWDIITKNNFDPFEDLDTTGECVRLSTSGLRLEKEIYNYFLERKEDS
jgi:glycosyltransferase involved in cell wall biosynthesis